LFADMSNGMPCQPTSSRKLRTTAGAAFTTGWAVTQRSHWHVAAAPAAQLGEPR